MIGFELRLRLRRGSKSVCVCVWERGGGESGLEAGLKASGRIPNMMPNYIFITCPVELSRLVPFTFAEHCALIPSACKMQLRGKNRLINGQTNKGIRKKITRQTAGTEPGLSGQRHQEAVHETVDKDPDLINSLRCRVVFFHSYNSACTHQKTISLPWHHRFLVPVAVSAVFSCFLHFSLFLCRCHLRNQQLF